MLPLQWRNQLWQSLEEVGSSVVRAPDSKGRHVTTKQRCQYITLVDIKTRRKRIQSLIQNHTRQERSESVRELRIALYKSDQ